jgi:hypothetical protein
MQYVTSIFTRNTQLPPLSPSPSVPLPLLERPTPQSVPATAPISREHVSTAPLLSSHSPPSPPPEWAPSMYHIPPLDLSEPVVLVKDEPWRHKVFDFIVILSDLSHSPVSDLCDAATLFYSSVDSFTHDWFIRECCPGCCFSLEFAFSIVKQFNAYNAFSSYTDLILAGQRSVRLEFAHLVSLVMRDIAIETATWRFSNPDGKPYVMTMRKKEIQEHEQLKQRVIQHFINLRPPPPSVSQADSDRLLAEQSDMQNAYLAYIHNHPAPQDDLSINSNLVLHMQKQYTRRLFQRTPVTSFHGDEMQIIVSLSFPLNELGIVVDRDLIISDSMTRILFVYMSAILCRLRTSSTQLEHTQKSMSKRLVHSYSSFESRLVKLYIPLYRRRQHQQQLQLQQSPRLI